MVSASSFFHALSGPWPHLGTLQRAHPATSFGCSSSLPPRAAAYLGASSKKPFYKGTCYSHLIWKRHSYHRNISILRQPLHFRRLESTTRLLLHYHTQYHRLVATTIARSAFRFEPASTSITLPSRGSLVFRERILPSSRRPAWRYYTLPFGTLRLTAISSNRPLPVTALVFGRHIHTIDPAHGHLVTDSSLFERILNTLLHQHILARPLNKHTTNLCRTDLHLIQLLQPAPFNLFGRFLQRSN